MSRRHSFSLLVVRGDAARVLRFTVSARLAVAGMICFVLTGAAIGTLLFDWYQLRRDGAEPGARRTLAEQRALIARMQATAREIRMEMESWRDVHARLLDAVGPDRASVTPDLGIGGAADRRLMSVAPHDELGALAAGVAEESRNLRTLDRLLARAAKMLAALPTRWPVRGPINSEFGNRASPWASQTEFHSGIDIRAASGTPVRAPAAGLVSFAGWHPEYGLAAVIDHGQDVKTIYGHLSKVSVRVGQAVEADGTVGLTGSTGRSSGPHLHYEIFVQGQPVNPRAYLWD